MQRLTQQIKQARLRLLQMHFESGVGHIGGNLSSIDILMALYHLVLEPNDLFVLSKGHSAGALYVTLWSQDKLSDDDLKQFHKDNTHLSGHPPANANENILFATGSLGHGLSLAAGLALGKKLQGHSGRVFCLMSDGEWNEGSCWEALIFSTHQNLDNLTLIIDNNGLQGFGSVQEVANIEPLAAKFQAFGVETYEVNGHNIDELRDVLIKQQKRPKAIVAHTIKGCGVSFMENKMEWHYLPLNESLYQEAVKEINQL